MVEIITLLQCVSNSCPMLKDLCTCESWFNSSHSNIFSVLL